MSTVRSGVVDRAVSVITARCLASAARRWPAAIREDQHAEWSAELHALRAGSDGGLRGAWRRLRFAVSLATAPAVEDVPEPGRPRRATTPAGRSRYGWRAPVRDAVGPVLVLLAAPLLVLVTSALICAVVEIAMAVALHGGDAAPSRFVFTVDRQARLRIDWPAHVLQVVAIGLCLAVAVAAGRWFGGRLPLRAVHRGGLARAGSAVVAPLVTAAGGVALFLGVAGSARTRSVTGYAGPDGVAGIAVWVAATLAAGWWLAHRAGRAGGRPHGVRPGWRRLGAGLPVLAAAFLVADAAVTVAGVRPAAAVGAGTASAAAWFPMSLLCPDGWAAPGGSLTPLTAVSSELFDLSVLALTCAGFVLAYGARAGRAGPRPRASGTP